MANTAFRLLPSWFQQLSTSLDCPEEVFTDPEQTRRARLVWRFGVLGALFGTVYASFYLAIGHKWGALIIVLCSSCFALTPVWLRCKRTIEPAGHFLNLVLTCGFTALCLVEGGLQGHAIAWLVSVPLCALLLLGEKAARRWAIFAVLAASLVAALDLLGIQVPVTYDRKWQAVVSSAGYLGLIVFMFILGLIFETSRKRAFSKMEVALTELGAANERLVHLNQEKNEFLGMAAHDLKNPLTIIVGCADMAGLTEDEAEVQKFLASISDAATRMRNMISDLLDVNAIEQGQYASKIEPCDMGALVRRSVENNRPAAARKSIAIQVDLSEGQWVKADPAAVLQILDNLISNALKYSPPHTKTRVRINSEGHYVAVAVRDEGPGINESEQKRLFQKYTRLSARPTGGESSTGLGLAIVKRLAEAMSGTIRCESALGAGSTFILRLPRDGTKKPLET